MRWTQTDYAQLNWLTQLTITDELDGHVNCQLKVTVAWQIYLLVPPTQKLMALVNLWGTCTLLGISEPDPVIKPLRFTHIKLRMQHKLTFIYSFSEMTYFFSFLREKSLSYIITRKGDVANHAKYVNKKMPFYLNFPQKYHMRLQKGYAKRCLEKSISFGSTQFVDII